MEMLDALNWWRSFRRNANFWDWVRDTYSDEELARLTHEATDCTLIRPLDWLHSEGDLTRKTVRRLIERYGTEIWGCCIAAGGADPEKQLFALESLSKLSLATQVYNQETFEEFLVRNALKAASEQLIKQGRRRQA